MRWPLLLLPLAMGCDDTFDPTPPQELPYDVRTFSIASNRTLIVTAYDEQLPNNLEARGAEVPAPHDPDTGEVAPLDLPPVSDVAVGRRHACVVSPTGSVHCWGDHEHGALGSQRVCKPPAAEGGSPDCILGVGIMPSLPPVRELAAGDDVTCAITREDRVVCWGRPGPQLGGSVVPALDPPTPVAIAPEVPLAAARVIVARGTVCAIDHDATLWCWGTGFGATPQRQPYTGVVDVALGTRHSCVIDARGLTCWGDNRNAQVGDAAAARRCPLEAPCTIDEPYLVPLDAVRVVVGERHTCALLAGGGVACFGSNEVGQLGRTDAFLVGDIGIALPGTVVELAAGYAHTCALASGGRAWCWGSTGVAPTSETP